MCRVPAATAPTLCLSQASKGDLWLTHLYSSVTKLVFILSGVHVLLNKKKKFNSCPSSCGGTRIFWLSLFKHKLSNLLLSCIILISSWKPYWSSQNTLTGSRSWSTIGSQHAYLKDELFIFNIWCVEVHWKKIRNYKRLNKYPPS